MGSIRIATRVSGKKVKVFLTRAGSVAAGKRLAQNSYAQTAQACLTKNKGKGVEPAKLRRACLKALEKKPR